MERLACTEIYEIRELRIKLRQRPPVPDKRRPEFRRDKIKTTSVRFGKELFRDAVKFAQVNEAISGGTFNGLVEFLLWQALGSDEKYLKDQHQD